MRKIISSLLFSLILFSCQKELEAPVPNPVWDLFESSDALPLQATPLVAMNGVYSVTEGNNVFGDLVAIKSSYVVNGGDTTYHLSVFCGKDIAYFVFVAKSLDSTILLNGYWRKMINTETGISRFTISFDQGARQLLSPNPVIGADSIIIHGVFGQNQETPEEKITFRYLRPLNTSPFQILAHRSGGRTADLIPASENSVELINMASQFGATGIEIDIRLTSDGVPILYHDNTLNLRLIQPCGLFGPIESYSYAQLSGLVRLIHGEKIPTLQEALEAVVYNTPIEYVWLDTKYAGDLTIVREIQQEALQKASAVGRNNLQILIGLPATEQLESFKQLNDYTNVPSLCELTLDNVRSINARVWAPRWTEGTQVEDVNTMHTEGRKAFVWTMDVPEYIRQFISEGEFDGILSNYPSIVAYYHYVR